MEKLTDNNEEVNLESLIESQKVQLQVPHYQRNYKWTKRQIDELINDIDHLLHDGESEIMAHFMGAIIAHKKTEGQNQIHPLSIIDGQQRLTSIFLALLACIETLSNSGAKKEAANLMEEHILLKHNYIGTTSSNLRLQVARDDSESMNHVVSIIEADLKEEIMPQHRFKPSPSKSKTASKNIESNYKRLLNWCKSSENIYGETIIHKKINILLQNLTFVYIGVKNYIDGPKIFDRLNSKGQPLTIAELVKNDIFNRIDIQESGTGAFENFESVTWDPFHEKFEEEKVFQNYFYPYGLLFDPKVTKATVYPFLQKEWEKNSLTPEQIIEELSEYQNDYLDIAIGGKNLCNHSKEITKRIKRLQDLGQPITIYPFLMKLSYELRNNREKEDDVLETFSVIESFLVRRMVFGNEATGLDKIFKNLWKGQLDQLESGLSLAKRVEENMRTYKSVHWPNEKEFREKLTTRPLYGSRVTKFLLTRYDESLKGESPSDNPDIEHVLPQTINGKDCWKKDFNKNDHKEYKDRIGNLTLITKEFNSSKKVSNACYSDKREAYINQSMWEITRKIGLDSESWTKKEIVQRSKTIADWAVTEWKF